MFENECIILNVRKRMLQGVWKGFCADCRPRGQMRFYALYETIAVRL